MKTQYKYTPCDYNKEIGFWYGITNKDGKSSIVFSEKLMSRLEAKKNYQSLAKSLGEKLIYLQKLS